MTMCSQLEQDKWVTEKLGYGPGYFVEVGAFDGVTDSNTVRLEKLFGWEGILIEADPIRAEACRLHRQAEVVEACVGPDYNTVDFFIAGQWSSIRSLTRHNILEEHIKRNNPSVQMRSVPLQTILFQCKTPDVID